MKKTIVAILLCASSSQALEFTNLGTVGLGGAGVARPPAGLETYWNPAALAFGTGGKRFSATITVDGASRGNLPDSLKRLSDSTDRLTQPGLPNGPGVAATHAWVDAGTADNIGIDAAFFDMARHPGSTVRGGGGLALAMASGNWGFGLLGSARSAVSVRPDLFNILPDQDGTNPIDLTHLNAYYGTDRRPESHTFFGADLAGLVDSQLTALGMTPEAAASYRSGLDSRLLATNPLQLSREQAAETLVAMVGRAAAGGGLIGRNDSRITTTGLVLTEAPLSYGQLFDLGRAGRAGVGVTLKAMFGRVYATEFRAFMTDIATAYERLSNNYRDSAAVGLDAGAIWERDGLRLAVTGKQLNAPAFDRPGSGSMTLRPSLRAGGEYLLGDRVRLVADIDLTRSSEIGSPVRHAGGGIEFSPGDWRLRLGVSQNLAARGEPVVSAGIGYEGGGFSLGLDGACGTGATDYDGTRYPDAASLQLMLGYRF